MPNPYLDDAPVASRKAGNPYLDEDAPTLGEPANDRAHLPTRGHGPQGVTAHGSNVIERANRAFRRGVPEPVVLERLQGELANPTSADGLGSDPFEGIPHQAPGRVIARQPAVLPNSRGQTMRAATIDNTERSWGDALGDVGNMLTSGVDSGAAALTEAPVRAINALGDFAGRIAVEPGKSGIPRLVLRDSQDVVPLLAQPESVQAYAQGKRESAEQARSRVSMGGNVRDTALGDADGFVETLKLVAEHPGVLGNPAGQTIGNLIPGLVTGPNVTVQIATQAIGAGASSAQEVEQVLIESGVEPDEAARTANQVFAASALMNTLIPKAVPGAQAAEGLIARTLAGEATKRQLATSAATRFAVPALGETVGEAIPEGLDQVIQNLATGKPLGEGVGSATALGALLGAPGGVVAGTVDAATGQPIPAATPAPVAPAPVAPAELGAPPSAQPAETARPSTPPATSPPVGQTDLDALLTENIPAIVDAIGPEGVQAILGDPEVAAQLAPALDELGGPLPPLAPAATPSLGAEPAQAPAATQAAPPAAAAPVARVAPTGDGVTAVPKPAKPAKPKKADGEFKRQWVPTGQTESAGGKTRRIVRPVLDYSRDSLIHWLAANGGINADSLRQNADFDYAMLKDPDNRPFGRLDWPAARKNGGMTADQLLEKMQESGWLPPVDENMAVVGINEATDMALDALNGRPVLHPTEGREARGEAYYQNEQDQAEYQAEYNTRIDNEEAQREGFADMAEREAFDQYMAGLLDREDIDADDYEAAIAVARDEQDGIDRDTGSQDSGTDAAGLLRPAVEGRAGQEAGQRGDRQGADRSPASTRPAGEEVAPRVAEDQAGLFPPATTREQVAGAARDKEAKRDGRNSTEPTPSASGLPLFAGRAPEQSKIPAKSLDQIKVRIAVEATNGSRNLNVSADRAADLLTKRTRILEQLRECVLS